MSKFIKINQEPAGVFQSESEQRTEAKKLTMLAALKFHELQAARDSDADYDFQGELDDQLKEYLSQLGDNELAMSLIDRRIGFVHNGVLFEKNPKGWLPAVVCKPCAELSQIEELGVAA